MKDIKQSYRDKSFLSKSGAIYLPSEMALNFIDDCETENIPIIGIEELKIKDDGKIYPQIDGLADFSNIFQGEKSLDEIVKKSCEASRRFLKSRNLDDSIYYDFVLHEV